MMIMILGESIDAFISTEWTISTMPADAQLKKGENVPSTCISDQHASSRPAQSSPPPLKIAIRKYN
jgi:hypothetical protein